MADSLANAGGFLRPSVLPSPSPSVAAGSSVGPGSLPTPRRSPLRQGSSKETAFINHVDQGITQINRRFARRNAAGVENSDEDSIGYTNFKQVAQDIDRLADVVWVSGTPSLQISYFLNLALLVRAMLPSFPPHPKSLFRLLQKLDLAFASLIQGRDLDSGETLPGFEGGRGVNPTEKVRIKSLVERTRVAVVEVMNRREETSSAADDADTETENEYDSDVEDDDLFSDFDMDVARVYDRTLVQLGDTLEGPSIGIPD